MMTLKTPAMFVAALAIAVSGTALAQSQPEKGAPSQAATKKAKQSQTGQNQAQQSQAEKTKAETTEKAKTETAEKAKAKTAEKATGASSGTLLAKQQSSETLVSGIIGMTVKDGAGKKAVTIGNINDVVLNKNNKVVGVLVGVGGFLGIAETNYGVAWDALQINKGKGVVVVDITRKQLDQASPYMTLAEEKAKQQQQQQRMKQKMQQQQKPSTGGMTTQ